MAEEFGEPVTLDMLPGIFTEETDSGAEGRWKDGNLIRFKNALPQSLGGWESKALSGSVPIRGIPRSLNDWVALDTTEYAAVATEKRLYLIDQSYVVYNITPIRDEGQLTDPFSTNSSGGFDPNSSGDARFVSVAHTSHGVQAGDIVTFDNATAVGGITIDGDYEVVAITDTSNYIIQHSVAATSTVAGGGGTVDYIYEITVGSGATGELDGYGVGPYGEETWGTPREESSLIQELRTWSLDNWGEDLIASPRNGAIYHWDKTNGTSTRAVLIANAPSTNKRVLVSPESRQIIALGAHNGVSEDPMRIAWCDSEDFTTWTASTGNTAGDKRIEGGSEIVTGIKTRAGVLIFTDESVHIMQPVAGNDIYSVRQISSGIAIASPNASADANGVVYSMGQANFYRYDGVMSVLPSEVWTKVFGDFNFDQASSVYCSHSKDFNEIWWFYPSAVSVTNDKYVIYNYVENIWYFGIMDRASFHDFSSFADRPYGMDSDGNFYLHEQGVDADGDALSPYIESYDLTFDQGDKLIHVSKLIPDFKRLTGNITVTLKGRKYPRAPQFSKGPYGMNENTAEMGVRIRARQIALRVEQSGVGQSFRMGSWKARVRPDGER